jgi:hypothetical protein
MSGLRYTSRGRTAAQTNWTTMMSHSSSCRCAKRLIAPDKNKLLGATLTARA